MNTSSGSWSRADVLVYAQPEWLQVIVAFTPLVSMLLVLGAILWCSFRPAGSRGPAPQGPRRGSWDQMVWALDMAMDADPRRRKAGMAVLNELRSRNLLSRRDAEIVAQVQGVLKKP